MSSSLVSIVVAVVVVVSLLEVSFAANTAPPAVTACTQTVKAGEQLCVNHFNQQMAVKASGEEALQKKNCCSYWRFKACTLALFTPNPNCLNVVKVYLE